MKLIVTFKQYGMYTVIIIQTPLAICYHMRGYLEAKLNGLIQKHSFIFTDSFDDAVAQTPKEGEVLVFTCDKFQDAHSEHQYSTLKTIADEEKSADMLAKMIKKINKQALIYLLATEKAQELFIEGFIDKKRPDYLKKIEEKIREFIFGFDIYRDYEPLA